MFKAVKSAVEATHYDIVQVEFTPMGQYVDALAGHPRTIFREHDLAFVHFQRRVSTESKPWRRLYHYEQWRRMVRYELDVCRQFHKIIVPSPQAKSQLLAQAPNLDVEAVSFGVTLPETLAPAKTLETRRVLFVGAMGRPLNVESVLYFYRQIWPLIRADEPSAEFWISGSQPPEHICQLAQTDSSVRVTGFVDDLISIYSQASVVVVPLLVGGGVVTKILDALALAKPVVTTSAANEGIGALSGQDLIVADEPDEFAKWVVDLLRDPALRARLGQSGRRLVKERFSWPRIIDQLEQIYVQLLNGT
jgi:glycosyltransferase involved in cell wall biosynthesis